MDDVINPNEVVNDTAGTEPTTPSTEGESETEEQPAQAGGSKDLDFKAKFEQSQRQIENLNKALRATRKSRSLPQPSNSVDDGGDGQDLYNNPEFQKVWLENATYQLKDGVREVLERYPQLPKQVARAIAKNPRGWVNEGTQDVSSALIDIEENILNELTELESQQSTTEPKQVSISRPNTLVNTQRNVDIELERIRKTPPDDWTEEDEKIVDAHLKSQGRKV